jgi:hypothetical protein
MSGFELDNISVIAPTGTAPGTEVRYAFNFSVTGVWRLNQPSDVGFFEDNIVVGLDFSTQSSVSGPIAGGLGTIDDQGTSDNPINDIRTGVFTSFANDVSNSVLLSTARDASGRDTTGLAMAGSSIDFGLSLSIVVSAGDVGFNASGDAAVSADFLDPLAFPTDAPVVSFFDLSGNPLTGWTADSSDGCIVNNHFTCAAAGPAPAPEPGTFALFAGAAAMVPLCQRRGRRLSSN